jgi:hypothetical protein
MTIYERSLFQELIDINYEIESGNHNKIVKIALLNDYHRLQQELISSMGRQEWDSYIKGMREMFAPKGESI